MICTAEVDQQIRAVAKNIEDQVKTKTGDRVFHREGLEALNWVLLDYVDVVVHIFKPSFREFYKLEDLWGDAEAIPVIDKPVRVSSTVRRRPASSDDVTKPLKRARANSSTAGTGVKKTSSRNASAGKKGKPKAATKSTKTAPNTKTKTASRKRG